MTTTAATFTSPLVIGSVVTGFTERRGASGRVLWFADFSGTYTGLGASEWDGEPMHHFTEGVIGTTPQARFAIPAAMVSA